MSWESHKGSRQRVSPRTRRLALFHPPDDLDRGPAGDDCRNRSEGRRVLNIRRHRLGSFGMAVNDLIAGRTLSDARRAARAVRGHCETLPPILDAEAFGAVFDRFA